MKGIFQNASKNFINSQSKDEIKFVDVSQYFQNIDIQLKEDNKFTLVTDKCVDSTCFISGKKYQNMITF